MLRATPRRILLYLIALFSGILLLGNIQQFFRSAGSEEGINQHQEDHNITETEHANDTTEDDAKPWYMKGGLLRPSQTGTQQPLFPQDAPGQDRITSE